MMGETLRPWISFAMFVAVATIVVPILLFFSPGLSFLVQALEGVWLACACWVLASSGDSDARCIRESINNAASWSRGIRFGRNGHVRSTEVQSSRKLSPYKKHGGPLEYVISLPAVPVVWLDMRMRDLGLSRYLRFAILNLTAFVTGPIWFFVITAMHLLLLLAVTAVSFGVLLPWTAPLILTIATYLCFVPVWVISTYVCSSGPMMVCTWLLPLLDDKAVSSWTFVQIAGISMAFGPRAPRETWSP
mmetsp:Transcript_34619/g.71459  ORF Transcript_34619/g.71459 Transcript_34619/m.71459 type:complete len:247 (+) Transcript_34619:44-784(+)